MKKRHYLFINLIFVGLMIFSATVVIQFMTGYKPFDFVANLFWRPKTVEISPERCSNGEALPKLAGSGNESLKKLATYQQACRSFVTDTFMVFLSMAGTETDARQYATQDAKMFKTFAAMKVRPLVILEPTDHDGNNLNFEQFASGQFNPVIEAYFTQLKQEGVTDSELGIITPFPEANLPYWNNNQVQFFSPAVNNYLTIARKYFPQVATSILLNSATYEVDDFNWENGDYNSLIPYIKNIKPGLVTYAGVQGFPWISRPGGSGIIFNASEFLNAPLLDEMAVHLQVKKVWFNTGTFSRKYTLNPEGTRMVSSQQRKEILMTIQQEAQELKDKGYEVAINIFAEDKSETSEETDWSYWKGNDPLSSPDTTILTSFIKDLHNRQIGVWLFDR